MARDILRQPALQPFVRREVLPGPDVTSREALFNYACRLAKTDHHPVGTCRMGCGEMAVVDPELKVQGLDGLRICDSSIMPTIMIGEKASDLVRRQDPLPAAVFEDEHNDGLRREIV